MNLQPLTNFTGAKSLQPKNEHSRSRNKNFASKETVASIVERQKLPSLQLSVTRDRRCSFQAKLTQIIDSTAADRKRKRRFKPDSLPPLRSNDELSVDEQKQFIQSVPKINERLPLLMRFLGQRVERKLGVKKPVLPYDEPSVRSYLQRQPRGRRVSEHVITAKLVEIKQERIYLQRKETESLVDMADIDERVIGCRNRIYESVVRNGLQRSLAKRMKRQLNKVALEVQRGIDLSNQHS